MAQAVSHISLYKLPPYHFLRDTYDELIRYQFINYIQNKEAKTTLENNFPNANAAPA